MDMNRFIIIFVLFTLLLAFVIFYSYYEIIDSFGFSSATLGLIWKQNGKIIINPVTNSIGFFEHNINQHSGRPIAHLFVGIFSLVSGIPIINIIFIPIPFILSAIVFYNFLKRHIDVFSIFFVVSIGIIVNNASTMASTFYYISLGYSLSFLALFLIYKFLFYYESKLILLPILIFALIAPFTYYTSSFIITTAIVFFLVQLWLSSKSLRYTRFPLISLFATSIITFSLESIIYHVLKIISIDILTQSFAKFYSIIISILFGSVSYSEYKPVFLHYQWLINILNNLYLICLLSLLVISFIIVKFILHYKLSVILFGHDDFRILGLFLFLSIWQIVVYFGVGEFNYALLWIYIALFIARWSFHLRGKGGFLNLLAKFIYLLMIVLLVIAYFKQFIFVIDNTYSLFFSNREPLVLFYLFSYPTLCNSGDHFNVYLIHLTYAYVLYYRALIGNYDCVNIKYFFISPLTTNQDICFANRNKSLIYVHHSNIPYPRVGVLGVLYRNVLYDVIRSYATQKFIIYSDIYNQIYLIPPRTILC